MDKKQLSTDQQFKKMYEQICFALMKNQLDKCGQYGTTTLEAKVDLFNLIVNVHTFVHKDKITGHKYDQDICCIENLLVRCNLHSPEFLAILIEKYDFSFETKVLLEMLVRYAKENDLQVHDVILDAISEHDLIESTDNVFREWLTPNEENSTLIAKVVGGMDSFKDIGKFLNTLLKDYSEDPVNFVISVFNWDIKDTNGSIIRMVEALGFLSEQDKQTLIAKFTHQFSLTSKGKVKNQYERNKESEEEASEYEDDSDDNEDDSDDDEDDSEGSDDDEDGSEGSDNPDIKPKSKRTVIKPKSTRTVIKPRGKGKTSAIKLKSKKKRKLN